MPAGYRPGYDDGRPRRARRRRRRGLSPGAWAAVAGGVLLFAALVVVAVVLARRGGRDRPAVDPLTGLPAATPARVITADEFRAIKKTDTIATLEARFGPARRLTVAEMDRVQFEVRMGRHPRAVTRQPFSDKVRVLYGVTDPECYYWGGREGRTSTDLYVVLKHGDPAQTLLCKLYQRKSVDENGHFDGQTALDGAFENTGP